MGGKLEVKYLGPYEVVSLVGKGRAKLKNVASGKELKNLYYMVNLKLYKQEDMNTSGQDDDDIAVEEPLSNIAVEEPTSNSAVEEPMCNSHVNIPAEEKSILLMFVDEEIVNNVEEGKQLVAEEDVQTKPEQLPVMLLMRKEKLEDV